MNDDDVKALEHLVGKKIRSILIDNSKEQLLIIAYDQESTEIMKFDAVGDCCSSSWFEHISDPILEAVVTHIEMKNLKDDTEEDGNTFRFYFYEVMTEKGSFTIEMRNQSNGYYGGWILFHSSEVIQEQL